MKSFYILSFPILVVSLLIIASCTCPDSKSLTYEEDKEHGVICYKMHNKNGISCVKVKEENPSCNAFK